MEFREELILENGEILPAQHMGMLFNVAEPSQPPQYVSAIEAATFGNHPNVQYEYSPQLFERFKLEDPFLLFDSRDNLPPTLTEAEKNEHVSTKYPNTFYPIYVESQSELHMGRDVITPSGIEAMTPAGFDSLEICQYPIFMTDYQSTRRLLSTTTDHCNSRESAMHLLRQTLEDFDLKGIIPAFNKFMHSHDQGALKAHWWPISTIPGKYGAKKYGKTLHKDLPSMKERGGLGILATAQYKNSWTIGEYHGEKCLRPGRQKFF
jgi:hypothetical protein